MSTAFESANVTPPGPLDFVHVAVTAPGGFGSPSSFTVPSSDADAGSVMDRFGPASTVGGVLGPVRTVIRTESATAIAPSSATRRRM